ncbi:endonuclease/exonuclease/phosphatase family protein [Qipengyuania sp. XHP0211]|uniref:endonuclease/exonuclease/phosphatase family protein n=1 Tax=Qipengyuania sp. XHP0211 TaxID=3038079 RepID=UPI00241F8214|nr:endonuclease/exonuclease/phosphatase family protein [Qipengyuania sp. XHP0211]MDG5752277.1 endonuclease/exonuclease/phosphatase family protein [Qipengyuania sp. XHP0211]
MTMRSVAGKIVIGALAVLLIAALVSLWGTNRGAVRLLDTLREPSIYLAAALVVLGLFVARSKMALVVALGLISIGINLWRIWPYTFLAPAQVPLPDEVNGMSCAKVLSFNVLQTNDRYDATAQLIEAERPDILLLMETNQVWLDALQPQLARYGYTLARPLENKYGMVFATTLQVDRAEMVANTNSNTPTLYATLRMGDGARFELIGLHPRPPLPGESTAQRDANIARAGSRTPDMLSNVLAIGDFNDVPWSSTTQKFVHDGGFSDPRAGRGSFATFPADYALFGWPLDQIFVKEGVKVETLEIGEDVGSDHLPVLAKVCVDPMSANSDVGSVLPIGDS